jgi:uncharacterized glyoxalase superfamily protein PhnB
MRTVTPNLILRDCAKAIEFYQRALGAQEISRFPAPDGRGIWHAELRIGDSVVFVNDEMPGMPRTAPTAEAPAPVTMWLYVRDCDAAFHHAVTAGAKPTMPPADMFWGDRVAAIADPYGYLWSFATHQKDLSAEEMRRGGEEFARSMSARR